MIFFVRLSVSRLRQVVTKRKQEDNHNMLFLVGRGTSLDAAGTGAVSIKEADDIHAEGMSSAAFRHGSLEMLREDIFARARGV